ncbi:MAG: hypothetical protein ABGW99_07645 [Zunongwangia sp.]|uniref:hypothetical protein n=1 Tax=Zunongwangia sp. TaxID=1965325 RepID=UPI00324214B4
MQKKIEYIIIVSSTILFFIGCGKNLSDNVQNFPIIIDTLQNNENQYNTNDFGVSSSTILYIGSETDSIEVDHSIKDLIKPPPPPTPPTSYKQNDRNFKEDSLKNEEIWNKYSQNVKKRRETSYFVLSERVADKKGFFDTIDIEIIVDTTQKLKHDVSKYQWDDYYEGYPILIKNASSDTIVIGYESYIPIILQAKDENNNWNPIEKIYIFSCGNGLSSVLLPPNEIVLSSKPIYQGDFKTTLRVEIGGNYSNEYSGKINLDQFKKPNY